MSPQKTAKIKIYSCLLYTAHQAYQNWTLSVNLMNINLPTHSDHYLYFQQVVNHFLLPEEELIHKVNFS